LVLEDVMRIVDESGGLDCPRLDLLLQIEKIYRMQEEEILLITFDILKLGHNLCDS